MQAGCLRHFKGVHRTNTSCTVVWQWLQSADLYTWGREDGDWGSRTGCSTVAAGKMDQLHHPGTPQMNMDRDMDHSALPLELFVQ